MDEGGICWGMGWKLAYTYGFEGEAERASVLLPTGWWSGSDTGSLRDRFWPVVRRVDRHLRVEILEAAGLMDLHSDYLLWEAGVLDEGGSVSNLQVGNTIASAQAQ
jgi:hypothetical protein